MTPDCTSRMKIITSDGVSLDFDGSTSKLLMSVLEECNDESPIPVPLVSSDMIRTIQKWQSHAEDPIIESWDVLWALAHACMYLHMDEMLDRACRQMAHELKGKSPTEIQKMVRDYR